MKNWREIVVSIFVIVVAAATWYFVTHRPEPSQSAFFAEGTLIEDNEGLIPQVWHLVYAEPGFPGLTISLIFDAHSMCGIKGKLSACKGLLRGDRVRIEGIYDDDRILVKTLVFLEPEKRGMPIRLYYYNPEKDKDVRGNIQCSPQGLQYVERVISSTETPLTEAIKLLLQGDIFDGEKAQGITSEFPLFGVRLESAAIQNGIATLTFSDPQYKTSGGSCRVAVLWAQIEATAQQFPDVQEVHFEPSTLFQP